MLSNLKEVKARGAKVIVINTDNVFVPEDVYDYIITNPPNTHTQTTWTFTI